MSWSIYIACVNEGKEMFLSIRQLVRNYKIKRRGRYLSKCRRIDYVASMPGRRRVAMTFDDGPCSLPIKEGGHGLTEHILDVLRQFGARGTFNVIGDTSSNYPDQEGRSGTPYWNGQHMDHYPVFGKDSYAGAANHPDLIRAMLDGGHEVSNHSYRHLAFGSEHFVYGRRRFHPNPASIIEDLRSLHQLVEGQFGYTMRLARPPHYVENRGRSTFDIYAEMNYQYLGASVDGKCWEAASGFSQAVSDAVRSVENAISSGNLDGKIIFQKDGLNMSLQAPVLEALPKQLELLINAGYEVVPVSELLQETPFSDVGPLHPLFDRCRNLLKQGAVIAYRDNALHLDRFLSWGELIVFAASMADLPVEAHRPGTHPYAVWHEVARRDLNLGNLPDMKTIVTGRDAISLYPRGSWSPGKKLTRESFFEGWSD